MKNFKSHIAGILIAIVFAAITAGFVVFVAQTGLLPTKYLLIVGAVFAVLVLGIAILVWNVEHWIRFCIGTLLAVLLVMVMAVGSIYIRQGVTALEEITEVKKEVSNLVVYVKQEDAANSLADTKGYQFGILESLDRANTDEMVAQINRELGAEIVTREFPGIGQLVDALLDGTVNAIIMNEAYFGIITEMEGYENTADLIRDVTVKAVETVITEAPEPQTERKEQEPSAAAMQEETKESDHIYTILISGIDYRGGLVAKSNSDVNVLAVVNTETRQALLINTPRDYFVPLSISGGQRDKLTHAGIYGIDCCMDTIGMLYDVDVDYYFRVNFSGLKDIVNALDGVNVYSEYTFEAGGYQFYEGYNYLYGDQALAFSRERYSFATGDRQRGKNQMAVIQAVVNKALSPELLKNFTSLLSALEGSFEMNIPYTLIAKLVRNQLNGGGDWNMQTYSVNGSDGNDVPYSMSQSVYVMIPDQSTVDKAKELIGQVKAGEVITLE